MSTTIKNRVIGVDVSVDNTTIAVVDQRGAIIAEDRFPTTDYPDVNKFLDRLSEQIVMLAESSGGFETIRSVGMSAPSSNYVTGCIENAANIPWKGVIPMAAMLRDRIGLAVALGNDAHITAMGEYVYGSAHGMQNFVVVSFGHGGVGSCIFANGQPHLGANGSAGEVGHTCVKDGGRRCNCGRLGCLEEYTSSRGVVQTARELMEESAEPSLLRNLPKLTMRNIAVCCEQGDAMALEVYRKTGRILGFGLANIATVLNPEAIILTGGDFVQMSDWLVSATQEAFNEYVFRNIRDKVKLVVSKQNDAERDVLGAAALAWTVKEYSLFK